MDESNAAQTWVVVPMFNEAATIATVVSELRRSFPHVVCVDDGSSDDSADLASQAGATVLRHPINCGQGAALQTGFDFLLRHTDASHCVTFDADGQHRTQDAEAMLAVAQETGVQVILGSRFLGSCVGMPASRRRMLRLALRFSRLLTRLDLTDTHNGLRVLDRSALRAIRLHFPRMAYASELEASIRPQGLSFMEFPVEVTYTDYSRAKGQVNSNAVNILFDLTSRRLRVAR